MDDRAKKTPRAWVAIAILVGAALLAYSNSFQGVFVFDDIHLIRSGWIQPTWANVLRELRGLRPTVGLSFLLSSAIGGQEPFGYHLVNFAVHLLAALVLFGLVRRVLGRWWIALSVALLWLVHPLETESVTYVSQRAQAVMGLFELLFLYAFVRSQEDPAGKLRWQAISIAAFALGMNSKPHMAFAPVLALLYERAFLGVSIREALGRNRYFYGALAALWLVLVGFGLLVLRKRGFDDLATAGVTPLEYAASQLTVVPHYLALSFWPSELVIDYDWPRVTTFARALPGAVLIAALLGGTIWAIFRKPAWGLLGAWFFLDLAPSSSFLPRPDLAVEHRMYVPLASVVLGAVLAFDLAWSRLGERTKGKLRHAPLALLVLVGLALAARTRARNEDYRSEVTFWRSTVAARPTNSRAQYYLATALRHAGDTKGALEAYGRSTSGERPYVPAFIDRSAVYLAEGRLEEALLDLSRAIVLQKPLSQQGGVLHVAYFDRGVVNAALGRKPQAIEDYTQAIALDAGDPKVFFNRALLRQALGDDLLAIADFTRAAEIQPDLKDAYVARAESHARLARYDEAWADVKRARSLGAKLRPAFLESLVKLSGRSE